VAFEFHTISGVGTTDKHEGCILNLPLYHDHNCWGAHLTNVAIHASHAKGGGVQEEVATPPFFQDTIAVPTEVLSTETVNSTYCTGRQSGAALHSPVSRRLYTVAVAVYHLAGHCRSRLFSHLVVKLHEVLEQLPSILQRFIPQVAGSVAQLAGPIASAQHFPVPRAKVLRVGWLETTLRHFR